MMTTRGIRAVALENWAFNVTNRKSKDTFRLYLREMLLLCLRSTRFLHISFFHYIYFTSNCEQQRRKPRNEEKKSSQWEKLFLIRFNYLQRRFFLPSRRTISSQFALKSYSLHKSKVEDIEVQRTKRAWDLNMYARAKIKAFFTWNFIMDREISLTFHKRILNTFLIERDFCVYFNNLCLVGGVECANWCSFKCPRGSPWRKQSRRTKTDIDKQPDESPERIHRNR